MFLRSAIAAFSMYSRIPMPGIVWNERTTRYLLCWFPAVGLAISAAQFFLLALLRWSDTGAVLKGVLLAALPLLITGGIHLDGFLDTVDARTSCAPWEKKLEILKDPHIGAFAAIYCGIYLLLSAGAWSEAGLRAMRIMVYVFPLERAMSGYLALKLPDARAGGSLAQLKDSSPRKYTKALLLIEAAVCVVGVLSVEWKLGLAGLCAMAIVTIYYRRMAMRDFGGVTGDLAGWYLQVSELAVLLTLVIAAKMV